MARNKVLEELLGDDLAQVRGITEKAMFGGWAWLLNGNLLCGARNDGMLIRLGKGNDAWALAMPGDCSTRGYQSAFWNAFPSLASFPSVKNIGIATPGKFSVSSVTFCSAPG
jgi:hypothetical protein